ncbi:MAG: heat-inducible transcriptional repressor HrcA [Rhodospirillales bacterium]|jgi:heat-inducible transcriptional repressor|nr:heat-inducible transcriptional repressor HrcA [Rhodospirillales bacterium]
MILELNKRSRQVFRQIVDTYLETGEPIGSWTLSRRVNLGLSPATIRNVMADLEDLGLLFAPHTSAGRLPTEAGLRLFVDGLLEVGNLGEEERRNLEGRCASLGKSIEGLLEEATSALSGLCHCASLVVAPKTESPLRHIEFVNLSPGRTLVVMVTENGVVENRVIQSPPSVPPSVLAEASNYMSARLLGRTLSEARDAIRAELDEHQAQLDELTAKVVEAGLATWSGEEPDGSLIVRGQATLLEDVTALADLERIRALFAALETKETMVRLLSLAEDAEGIQIFIGSDNQLFNITGCSMIVAPYQNTSEKIVGAIGVIGPTRMNYARIIPMVDYTAKMIGRLIG